MKISERYVWIESVRLEADRLAKFNIDVQIKGLGYLKKSDDRPVANFWRDENSGRWVVHLSPTASCDEQFQALERIWHAVTHPDTHRWWHVDGFTYGVPMTLFGAVRGGRKAFADSITSRIQEFLSTELAKATPAMLYANRYDDRERTEAERFPVGAIDYHVTQFIKECAPEVAAELRAEMARQYLTTAGLAEVLNFTPATARRIMNGTRPLKGDELKVVADWLDIGIDDLLTKPYQDMGAPDLSVDEVTA